MPYPPGVRSYDQYCPIAVALDVVGDRWTLLILRELLIGERRFTDLRTALPGLAPNLLTDRLRDLEREGLVERLDLPPPTARTVYAATADGRRTAPILSALARYGAARLPPVPSHELRPSMAVFGLLAPFHRPDGERLHVRLMVDGERFDMVSDGQRLSMPSHVADDEPDVSVTASARQLVAARRDGKALRTRAISGPPRQRQRLGHVFQIPIASPGSRP